MFNPILLTKSNSFIIGPVATILGYLMNAIFFILDKIGLPNIGLAIILFTFIIYMLMMPLTVKQQKFSKLQTIMQPEIQKIQAKYKNKKDNDSMMRMNEETQAVYKKYGVSPTGSCVQLLIQMPILFALYRVIYNFPAYVTQVKEAFFPLVDELIAQSGAAEYLQTFSAAAQFQRQFTNESFTSGVTSYVQNTFIDVLNRFSTADWNALSEHFSSLSQHVAATASKLDVYNNFLGLNIGNSPWFTMREAWADKSVIGIIAAVIVPLLAAVTQLINVALMPQPSQGADAQQDQMMNSMKTMNYMMPIMSAWFCFTLPAGMGLYWVAGSVIRSIQQVFINKSIDKMDIEAYIAKQAEKMKIKDEKRGDRPTMTQRMQDYAGMKTKNIDAANAASRPVRRSISEKASVPSGSTGQNKDFEKAVQNNQNKKYKEGSLASKANMVSRYNDTKEK